MAATFPACLIENRFRALVSNVLVSSQQSTQRLKNALENHEIKSNESPCWLSNIGCSPYITETEFNKLSDQIRVGTTRPSQQTPFPFFRHIQRKRSEVKVFLVDGPHAFQKYHEQLNESRKPFGAKKWIPLPGNHRLEPTGIVTTTQESETTRSKYVRPYSTKSKPSRTFDSRIIRPKSVPNTIIGQKVHIQEIQNSQASHQHRSEHDMGARGDMKDDDDRDGVKRVTIVEGTVKDELCTSNEGNRVSNYNIRDSIDYMNSGRVPVEHKNTSSTSDGSQNDVFPKDFASIRRMYEDDSSGESSDETSDIINVKERERFPTRHIFRSADIWDEHTDLDVGNMYRKITCSLDERSPIDAYVNGTCYEVDAKLSKGLKENRQKVTEKCCKAFSKNDITQLAKLALSRTAKSAKLNYKPGCYSERNNLFHSKKRPNEFAPALPEPYDRVDIYLAYTSPKHCREYKILTQKNPSPNVIKIVDRLYEIECLQRKTIESETKKKDRKVCNNTKTPSTKVPGKGGKPRGNCHSNDSETNSTGTKRKVSTNDENELGLRRDRMLSICNATNLSDINRHRSAPHENINTKTTFSWTFERRQGPTQRGQVRTSGTASHRNIIGQNDREQETRRKHESKSGADLHPSEELERLNLINLRKKNY